MSECYFCEKEGNDDEIDFHSKVGEHFCKDCEDEVFEKLKEQEYE